MADPRTIRAPRARLVAALLAAALLLVAGGCGGGDDGDTGTTTAASGENPRLTPDQWLAYQQAGKDFQAARAAAQQKLDSCPRSTSGTLDVYSECVGSSLADLQAAGTALGETLTGFIGTVSGACSESLDSFTQYTTPFAASVEQLQQTLADGNAAALANSISSVQTALSGGAEERSSFERDCAPL